MRGISRNLGTAAHIEYPSVEKQKQQVFDGYMKPAKKKKKKSKVKAKNKKKTSARDLRERRRRDREDAYIPSTGTQDITAEREKGLGKTFSHHSVGVVYSHGKKHLVSQVSGYSLPNVRCAGLYDYITIRDEDGTDLHQRLNEYGRDVSEVFRLFIGKSKGKVEYYKGHKFVLVKIESEYEYRMHKNKVMPKVKKEDGCEVRNNRIFVRNNQKITKCCFCGADVSKYEIN